MKEYKKQSFFLLTVIFSVLIFTISCATNNKKSKDEKIIIIERPERMFWEIKRGKSTVFLLGTIHLADENFYPIEEQILEAFDNADYLVSELGNEKNITTVPTKLQKKILDSLNLDKSKNLANFLDKEDLNQLYTEIGETNIKPLLSFDPWVLSLVLTEFLYQKAKLNFSQGIDSYFIARAESKNIEALETVDEQLEILSIGSFEEQLKRLYEAIETFRNCNRSIEEIIELKAAYLENDKASLATFFSKHTMAEKGMSNKEYQKYMDSILKQRNIKWAKKISSLLEREGTAFVFAGVGHFLGENSVQVLLKNKNY